MSFYTLRITYANDDSHRLSKRRLAQPIILALELGFHALLVSCQIKVVQAVPQAVTLFAQQFDAERIQLAPVYLSKDSRFTVTGCAFAPAPNGCADFDPLHDRLPFLRFGGRLPPCPPVV